jgi:hypothetical protein
MFLPRRPEISARPLFQLVKATWDSLSSPSYSAHTTWTGDWFLISASCEAHGTQLVRVCPKLVNQTGNDLLGSLIESDVFAASERRQLSQTTACDL